MHSFLESVLDDFSEWKTDPESCIFVLPSKRAGYFLKNLMARKAGKAMLAPEVLSAESFAERMSGLRYATQTKLLFCLYESFIEQEGIAHESFFDFSKWGQTLLQDFNEIDRYLVEPGAFFSYLGSLQEIRHWTPDGSSTPMIDKRVRFWKSLEPIYHRFRGKLASEGLGYQGQVYRQAEGQGGDYLEKAGGLIHIFMGFNALNRAEESIIQQILEGGNGRIYWDADPYYLEDPVHDAGLFLRKYKASWPYLQKHPIKGLSSYFNSPKEIQITGLPKSVSQAKYAGTLIEKLLEEHKGAIGHTALVLGEESLMNPVLNSLPETLDAVNVTMGYPLEESPLSQLFQLLFDVFMGASKDGLPARGILKVLSQPSLQSWFSAKGCEPYEITARMVRENTVWLSPAELESLQLPPDAKALFSPDPFPGPGELISRFRALIKGLKPVYQEQGDPVSLEYLYHFHALFGQLQELTEEYPFIGDLKALRMLYEQLLREDRIDFQGEPLQGLQIMGMLESRNLDFETVIITSVNEGILPAGKANASFIPYEVKKQFGMPTFKEKDAVYTYHFYRLLQRARSVYICYNTEPDVLEGGEASRFIHQLRNDPHLSPYIRHSLAAPRLEASPETHHEVSKSPSLLKLLELKASEGFSPTSLSQYVENPLAFYGKFLLGIRDSEELEETVAANTFGTVIHEALETLYKPLVGVTLKRDHIRNMQDKVSAELNKSYQKHFLRGSKARGKNLLALEVMNKYLDLFLQAELDRLGKHQIRLLGVEERMERELPHIPGHGYAVRLKGTVDRIEEVDGRLHIIDYKTGRVAPGDLRLKQWEELRMDPKKSKAFQVLCYAWLSQERFPVGPGGFRAGVFSFKNMGAGMQWYGLKASGRNYEETVTETVLEQFQGQLGALIGELFDPSVPFAEREDA